MDSTKRRQPPSATASSSTSEVKRSMSSSLPSRKAFSKSSLPLEILILEARTLTTDWSTKQTQTFTTYSDTNPPSLFRMPRRCYSGLNVLRITNKADRHRHCIRTRQKEGSQFNESRPSTSSSATAGDTSEAVSVLHNRDAVADMSVKNYEQDSE